MKTLIKHKTIQKGYVLLGQLLNIDCLSDDILMTTTRWYEAKQI